MKPYAVKCSTKLNINNDLRQKIRRKIGVLRKIPEDAPGLLYYCLERLPALCLSLSLELLLESLKCPAVRDTKSLAGGRCKVCAL